MAESEEIYCGPCEFKHLAIHAVAWCPVCNEGMCSDCKEQHQAFAITRKHEIISIENYKKLPSFALEVKQTCDEHDGKLEFYCYPHRKSCCLKCISSKHKECSNVCPMEEVVKNAKSSTALADTMQGISDLRQNINSAIKLKQTDLNTLADDKEKIEKETRDFRKELNNWLDRLESRIVEELHSVYQNETLSTKTFIKKLEKKETEIEQLEKQCSCIASYASDRQVFLATEQLTTTLETEEKEFLACLERKEMKTVNISFVRSNDFARIMSGLKEFGTLSSLVSVSNFNPVHRKTKQYMVPVKTKQISSIRLELKTKITFTRLENVRDCTILDNGNLVFVDAQSKCLEVYNSTGEKSIQKISLPLSPWSIDNIGESKVVVKCSDDKQTEVKIVDLKSSKSCTLYITDNALSNASYLRDELLVFIKEKKIVFTNLNGDEVRIIPLKIDKCKAIHVDKKRLFYVDHVNKVDIVHCCSLEAEELWNYELPARSLYCKNFEETCHMTNDDFGNLYVSCYHSSKLIVISSDGKNSRTLLEKADGLNAPTGIYYHKNLRQLLFCVGYSKAHVYKLQI